ncbi:glycine zipper 2TM domain-containing protein [Accumulibacter sp.]|uniref:glycine zipper 2TM domain-containing protein n=1 Tax=Accumulibacter sp. TaxID=2053492 RepID=UPI0025E0463E|nr:glycine zipper 2TM domain-containing protein [Accumulibacter sp.]MCM8595969.1 glycine zipper 2TM domain-containing protein [Accumulibacter sp.]MCM8625204.1 glycine zipper 2TM domain-containing protein [Accumulibacter sp.]MDS4050118.1 glycine zipper 2TM domain-containing protein [Accumulibacter sp.]
MTKLSGWRRFAAATGAAFTLLLAAGCETTPAFQVSQPSSRDGTVESIVQDTVQSGNAAVGTIGGAVVGGLLGNQIGGGRGQTAATVIGAGGGAFVGNQVAQRQNLVWRIGVRYDDGSLATIQQTSPPNLRIGDRVRVSANGITLLR